MKQEKQVVRDLKDLRKLVGGLVKKETREAEVARLNKEYFQERVKK